MSRIIFLIVYLFGMLPTYFLPYAGSNSFLASTVINAATGSGLGFTATILHIGALLLCVYASWARSKVNEKSILIALTAVAAVFDMTPFLSTIPLVPTILHIIALVMGSTGNDEAANKDSVPQFAQKWPLSVAVIVGGTLLFAGVWFAINLRMVSARAEASRTSALSSAASRSQAALDALKNRAPIKAASPAATTVSTFASPSASISAPPVPATTATPEDAARQAAASAQAVESARVAAEDRQRAEAQKVAADAQAALAASAAKAAVVKVNSFLMSPDVTKRANEYLASFVGFSAVGNTQQATALFGGSPDMAARIVKAVNAGHGTLGPVTYDMPVFTAAKNPKVAGSLLVVAHIPPAFDNGRDYPESIRFNLSLDSNNHFVAVPDNR